MALQPLSSGVNGAGDGGRLCGKRLWAALYTCGL